MNKPITKAEVEAFLKDKREGNFLVTGQYPNRRQRRALKFKK